MNPPPERRSPRRGRFGAWIGWLVSAAILAGILLVVPFASIRAAFANLTPFYLFPAACLVLVNVVLRGYRWALLFPPAAGASGRGTVGPLLAGLAVNGTLPGKVGEVARIVLGARRFGTGIAFTGVTVVADRLFDALALLGLLAGALFLMPEVMVSGVTVLPGGMDSRILFSAVRSLSVLSLVLLLALVVLMFTSWWHPIVDTARHVPLVGARFGRWGTALQVELEAAGAALRRGAILTRIVSLSFLSWSALALYAYLIGLSMESMSLSFLQCLVIAVISTAATSIPSTPGAWGVFEGGVMLAIGMLGLSVTPGNAMAFAIVLHAVQYAVVVVGGFIVIARGHVSIREMRWQAKKEEPESQE